MLKNWLRKKMITNAHEPPKFTTVEKITILVSIGIIVGSVKFGGVFISGGMIAGFGMVFGAAVVIAKFETIELFIAVFGKYIDMAILIFSLVIGLFSNTGMLVSTFAGIFLTAYLGINRYWKQRKLYKTHH